MKADELRTLSELLDHAFELPPAERSAWLEGLRGEAGRLAPTLRALLARQALGDSGASSDPSDCLDRPPRFFAPADAEAAEAEWLPGAVVGPYTLRRELGRGGMGEVWLAERTENAWQRQVALKLPRLHARRAVLVQRFARERDILGSFTHPHIARLYDAGLSAGGQPYLALEFVDGEPITGYCAARRLTIHARVQLLQQVLQAVQYAHAHLVVHRDLKPSNVLVTPAGHAMLLDFGIAKLLQEDASPAEETELTREGGRALSLPYAAPEQVSGAAVSTATDLWALGILLYELIAGARPFRSDDRRALERAILEQTPVRPAAGRLPRSLAADLDAIVFKALEKRAADRYPSADAMSDDLQRWLAGEPVQARPASAWYRARKFGARNRLSVTLGAAAFVVLGATAAIAQWQALEARSQARQAEVNAESARREARRAEAVQEFVLDIFRSNSREQADPIKAQSTTARELLDVGAARLGQSLKDAPESRLQVLAMLAEMYLQVGLRGRSVVLERERVALARSALPADDPRRAAANLALARLLYDGGGREEARSLIEEARKLLDAAGDQDSKVRGDLLLRSSHFYRYESWRDARANAEAAVAFFQKRSLPGLALVRAHHVAGQVHLAAFDFAQAQVQLNAGLVIARQRDGDAAMALVIVAGDLADVQQSIGQFAQAELTFHDGIAASAAINGSEGGTTLVLRIALGDLLLQTGRREAGLALRRDVRAAIARPDAKLDIWWRANAEYLLARNQPEFGRPGAVLPLLQTGAAELATELPDSGALVQRRRQLAEVLTALGHLDEADAVLADADRGWQRFTAGANEAWMNNALLLARGRLRLAQGRPEQAIELLQQIVPSRLPPDALIDLRLLRRDAALAEAWVAQGTPERAAMAAQGVLTALKRITPPFRLPHLEAAAWQSLGQAQAQLGERTSARASLERAVALRSEHDAPDSLWRTGAERALAQLSNVPRRSTPGTPP